MSLRVAVLTTDTPHHRWFLRQLRDDPLDDVDIALVLFETRPYPWRRNAKRHVRASLPNVWSASAGNPYVRSRQQERRQAAYEAAAFFPDGDDSLGGLNVHVVRSVNDADAAARLVAVAPDLLAVYGTGIVRARVFSSAPLGTVNAHGGLLPHYRGLDANLWAALEGRPGDMAVTLHQMDDGIDTGDVYVAERIGPRADLALASLRYHTTLVCTELYRRLLSDLRDRTATATPQVGEGRYFGPMPTLLKRRADRVLRAYAATA